MRPFARQLAACSGATALITAGLFARLEFRALAEDSARLRHLTDEDQRWGAELSRARGRATASRDIVTALSRDRITMTEAIDSVMTIANDSPDWVAQLRSRYCGCGFLPPAATDRDVVARFLRVHVESMKYAARTAGDRPRAAPSAHLARFENGHDSQPVPPSHQQNGPPRE